MLLRSRRIIGAAKERVRDPGCEVLAAWAYNLSSVFGMRSGDDITAC
jgi:hypothetical protein